MLTPMKRITITAPEELLEQLRQMAAARHISLAALIRESLEEYVERHNLRSRPGPLPRSLGIGASGYTDTSERASDPRDELFEPDSWR